jgi:hypothetical protein
LLLADGRGIPLKDVTLSGDTITFALELPQVKATFKGTLSADRKDLRGEFTQNGITSLLEVSRDSKKIADATPSIDPHELIEMMTSMPAALSDRPFVPPVTYPAIGYGVRTAHDPIAQLTADIDAGTLHLSFEKDQGYLHSLLNALKIPVESQMAVFSQTSLQAPLIGPQNPRVIYFNDSVIVASVRGGFIEVAAQDPELGAHFYTLLQQPVDKLEHISTRCFSSLSTNRSSSSRMPASVVIYRETASTFQGCCREVSMSRLQADLSIPLARISWIIGRRFPSDGAVGMLPVRLE